MSISILQLTPVDRPSYEPIAISKFRSLLRILSAACLRSFIKFARLRDSGCAPRSQHARVVSLGQHKGGSRAAALKSVFKQRASAANIGFPPLSDAVSIACKPIVITQVGS